MTDASTTGAVERLSDERLDELLSQHEAGNVGAIHQLGNHLTELAREVRDSRYIIGKMRKNDASLHDTIEKLVAAGAAAIQRAEAAESECARLKNIRSAIAEGYNAEAVALEKSVSETLTAQLTAARRAEAAAWNDAIEAAATVGDHYADMDYCAMGYPEDGGIAASGTAHTIRQDIRALRRAAPTEGEAQSLDDTTRAVLDRAERIVAGQSQQEQRTAEIFLRPTEGEA